LTTEKVCVTLLLAYERMIEFKNDKGVL